MWLNSGRRAVTHYTVLERFAGYTHIQGLGGRAEVGDVVGEHLVVAVEKHQPGGRGQGGAGVAGAGGAGARLVGDGDVEVGLTVGPPGHDLARRVARAVVDKDNAEVPIRLRPDRGQGASQ